MTLQHGKTRAHYLRITFETKKHKVFNAYVWHGYIEKGAAVQQVQSKFMSLDFLYNNTDYNRYIQQSKPQAITRAILKLFPRNKVTFAATKVATVEDGYYSREELTPVFKAGQVDSNQYAKIIKFPKIVKYLGESRREKTSVRIKEVKKLLAKSGYSAKKRAKLSKQYQIGLNIFDRTYYPQYVTSKDDYGDAFIIAEKK